MQMQQYPQMQYEQLSPDVEIPPIYQTSTKATGESFKEKIKKMDVMGLIYPWIEHPFLMLGTCAGLSWGVEKFSSSCGGEYETSLVGKAAKLGDNIQTSSFVQSKPFQSILGIGEGIKNKFNKIFKNSDVINAMKNTPSQPEWGFVKDELLNMQQRVCHDFTRITDTLIFPENSDGTRFVKLENLGVNKKDSEFVKKFFNGVPQNQETLSNAIQLKRLGLSDDVIKQIVMKPEATELVKAQYFEKLGVEEAFLQKLKNGAATKEDIAKVQEICKKAKGVKIGAGYQNWLGRFQPIARTIGMDEVGNRLISMTEAKTKLGRAFATFLQKCHRGFTFGGGKGGVLLFVSPLIVETMLSVKKAEPSEKVGTAAHGLVHSMSWVFTFPLALSILHKFGGMQYAGMSKEAVEECRTLIKEFNEKANPYKSQSFMQKIFGGGEKKAAGETFATFSEYSTAKSALKKRLKELRTVKDQNLLTKICKKAASVLTMDLECISAYKNCGTFGKGFLGRVANKLKNIGGVPLRVGIWAGITMGVLDPLINKAIKGCFGNYHDRYKEEEFENGKKAQKQFLKNDLQTRLRDAQKEKVLGLASPEPKFEVPPTIQQALREQQVRAKLEKMVEKEKAKATMQAETKAVANTESNITSNAETNLETKDFQKESIAPLAEQNTSALEQNPQISNETIKPVAPAVEKNISESVSVKTNLDTNTYIPSSKPIKVKPNETTKRDNYTYIPSSENLIKKDEKDSDVNKYIPSQKGAQFTKTFDNSGLEAALKRADRAEQRAIQTLAGNFNSY